jgi:drug/metabolite transporter (DMT)-like permease
MLLIGLTWVGAGVAVGLLVQLFARGEQGRLHAPTAALVGILGSFLGGLVSAFAFQSPHLVGDPDGRVWPGVLMSVVGAGLALAFYVYALRSLQAPDRLRGSNGPR